MKNKNSDNLSKVSKTSKKSNDNKCKQNGLKNSESKKTNSKYKKSKTSNKNYNKTSNSMFLIVLKRDSRLKLLLSVSIPLLAGFIGSIFTTPQIQTWYSELNKPFFNPPNWIFGPVWTLLYILMGISLFLVINSNIEKSNDFIINKKLGLIFFGIQIFLNTLWSILFFGMNSPLLGIIVISFLLCAIVFNIVFFYKIHKVSGIILIPYLLWVSFATILNIAIFVLN